MQQSMKMKTPYLFTKCKHILFLTLSVVLSLSCSEYKVKRLAMKELKKMMGQTVSYPDSLSPIKTYCSKAELGSAVCRN